MLINCKYIHYFILQLTILCLALAKYVFISQIQTVLGQLLVAQYMMSKLGEHSRQIKSLSRNSFLDIHTKRTIHSCSFYGYWQASNIKFIEVYSHWKLFHIKVLMHQKI